MRTERVKVELTRDIMTTFFTIYEHCGKKQYADQDALLRCNEITCEHCEEPVMFRGSNGLWYYAGYRVFP